MQEDDKNKPPETKFFDTEFSLFGKYTYNEVMSDISLIEQQSCVLLDVIF